MAKTPLWRFLVFLVLLALTLLGCGVTPQELRQEIQDESRGARENMARGEKTYEKREYLGITSKDSDNWNSTDWSMWMDTHGGGR